MTQSDFWSRRKSAVQAETQAEELAETQALKQAEEQALAERDDAELLAEAGMPEPEALESSEQVQEFLRAALPKRLKTRALRQLWKLNPVLANIDGLVDYGEDFTDSATVVENLQTVYQVGKGMISRLTEVEEELDPAPEPEIDIVEEEPQPEIAEATPPEAPACEPPQPEPSEDEEYVTLPAPKRRMQFHFDPPRGAS